MADAKLTAKSGLTAPALNDYVYIVDVSDTTDDPAGSSKKILVSDLIKVIPFEYSVALGDELTNMTTGTKVTFRFPFTATITSVDFYVGTAPTGSTAILDIKKNGTTIFSTKPSIDATETSSTTGATPAVISVPSVTQGDLIAVSIDQVGSTVPGIAPKLTIYYTRA